MLTSLTQDPVRVEGGAHTCGTHIVFSGHGAGLPFCVSRPLFRRQVFCGCFLAIGDELILLSPYNAGPVHHFRIPLQVIESALLFLLLGPLFLVFHGKVIPQVNPQRGVHGHVTPTKMCLVRKPLVDVPDDGGHQVTDAAGRIGSHIDKESCGPANIGGGRPSGPHCWTTRSDVLDVAARRHEQQLSSERGHSLCELGCSEPSGDHGHREGLLELPMLGAPFNDSEHLRCKLLCLVAERRQTLDSFMVGAESVENNGGTPSDVWLGILYDLVLQLSEFEQVIWERRVPGVPHVLLGGPARGLTGHFPLSLWRPNSWPTRFVSISLSAPITPVTLWPPTLTAFAAFTLPVTLWPFPTFAACPVEFRLAIHPCSWVTTVVTLILFFPTSVAHQGHGRGPAVPAF